LKCGPVGTGGVESKNDQEARLIGPRGMEPNSEARDEDGIKCEVVSQNFRAQKGKHKPQAHDAGHKPQE